MEIHPGARIEDSLSGVEIGKGVMRRHGTEVAILAFGSVVAAALEAAEALGCSVADMRFVKPLDEELLLHLSERHALLVSVEENVIAGGAGSAIAELLNARGIIVPLLQLGLPDRFLEHGKRQDMLSAAGLDAAGIEASVRERMRLIKPSLSLAGRQA